MRADYNPYPPVQTTVSPPLSVHAALDDLTTLSGQTVVVSGILRCKLEETALNHFPELDRRGAPLAKSCEASNLRAGWTGAFWLAAGRSTVRVHSKVTLSAISTPSMTREPRMSTRTPLARFAACPLTKTTPGPAALMG